ncbi:MAG: heavy metal transport/detoxification protein [Haloplasmataceae bacterium]|jgi:copper chaperone CopZ|nr:heavy metal transport/detoxification protein [Haloplasmataceae bacterium]
MIKKLSIQGMTCGHCKMHVETALKEVAGVTSVDVDLKGKSATVVLAKEVEDKALIAAVDEAGYQVIKIEA